jgi:hypothetical protein
MARLFAVSRAESQLMRKNFLRGVLTAFFIASAAAAQTQTPAETPAVEPAPESAPAEAVESAASADWTARATEAFLATYRESCAPIAEATPLEERKPDIYEFKYRDIQSAAEDPDQTVAVYRFFCTQHPKNVTHVFFMRNSFDDLQPLNFSAPTVHVDYENESPDGKVLGVKIIGMETQYLLLNSEVDTAANTISSYETGGGPAEASSSGIWVLKDGNFVLSVYHFNAGNDEDGKQEAVVDYRAENERLSEAP